MTQTETLKPPKPLTQRQQEALLAIWKYMETYSIPPTYIEVGRALDIGKSSSRVLFNSLRKKGLITQIELAGDQKPRYRNVVISEHGRQHVLELVTKRPPQSVRTEADKAHA